MQLRQEESALDKLNVRVVVVSFEAGPLARAYVEQTGLRWPLLVDSSRQLYHAYGMLKAGFWDIWGPRTWWIYLKLLCRGRRPEAAHGDVNQRGGDVLVDPQGAVRVHHVGDGPADRPAVQALLDAVRAQAT